MGIFLRACLPQWNKLTEGPLLVPFHDEQGLVPCERVPMGHTLRFPGKNRGSGRKAAFDRKSVAFSILKRSRYELFCEILGKLSGLRGQAEIPSIWLIPGIPGEWALNSSMTRAKIAGILAMSVDMIHYDRKLPESAGKRGDSVKQGIV